MKNYKINLPLFIFITIVFFCLNSFDNKEDNQNCQPFLIAQNKDLRHITGLTNVTVSPYENCVNQLQSPGAKRTFMIDSYENLLKYYKAGPPQKFQAYKKGLHLEIRK